MRKRFCVKLNKGLKSLQLPLGYLAIFVYSGIEPDKETKNEVSYGLHISGVQVHHQDMMWCWSGQLDPFLLAHL